MRKKIKIAQIIGDASLTGGPRHVLELGRFLKREGFEVLIIAPPGTIAKAFAKAKIPYAQVKMRGPFDRESDHVIRKILKEEKVDLVHCHGTRGGWLGRLAARKIRGLPIVYTEHLWTKDYHLSNPIWEQFQLQGLRYLDRFTQKTIAVSEAVQEFLIKSKITKPQKIVLGYPPVREEFFKIFPYQKPKEISLLVGSVGSLNRLKGYRYFVEAAKILKEKHKFTPRNHFHFQIVGIGPEETNLRRLIKRFKLEEYFQLRPPLEKVFEVMRHFTIYVQPSLSESFGMATAEAMAMGLPVIVTQVSGLQEIVTDGKTGLVVPSRNPQALALAIEKLLKDDKLRKQLAVAAKRKAEKEFVPEKRFREIVKIYEQLLKEAPKS